MVGYLESMGHGESVPLAYSNSHWVGAFSHGRAAPGVIANWGSRIFFKLWFRRDEVGDFSTNRRAG